jgi:hypothetical protein
MPVENTTGMFLHFCTFLFLPLLPCSFAMPCITRLSYCHVAAAQRGGCTDYSTSWMIRIYDSWQRPDFFFFSKTSRPALGPTLPPVQGIQGSILPGVKWPACEVRHSPPTMSRLSMSRIKQRSYGMRLRTGFNWLWRRIRCGILQTR